MTGALGDYLVRPPRYGIGAAATPYQSHLPTYIRITDIDEDGRFRPDPRVSVNSASSGNYKLYCGDLVVARTGASVGKSYLYNQEDGDLIFAGFLINIHPDPGRLDPRYLSYLLQSKKYWDWIASESVRSGQPGINARQLSQLPLNIPQIEVQRAIADGLNEADNLIASFERLIAKKCAIKQGMMQELLTGRTRLPGFSDPWQSGHLGDLYHRHSEAIDPRMAKGRLFQHFSLPAFDAGRVARVERGSLIDSIKFTVPFDAVLVSKLNPRISRVWVPSDISDSALASTEFIVMVPGSHVDRSFLGWLVSSQQVSSGMKLLATGTTKSHVRVSPSQVAGIAVRWPAYEEQVAICSVLDDVASEIEALERRLEATRDIKQGMMQELLTGRTPLPVDEEVAV